MYLNFTKMNGAGNDFIMLDNRKGHITLRPEQIAHLCDRHRGIGADGLLMVNLPSTSNASLRMRYYNADGYEAEMCGNGARCFTRYGAHLLEKITGTIVFETAAGVLEGELIEDQVKISMSQPHTIHLHESVGEHQNIHSLNTGVPHVVLFVDDLETTPVIQVGRTLRHHPHFAPAGTNVNFVKILNRNLLEIRTFERGVEDETLACGTGVVASAILHHLLSSIDPPIRVKVRGQDILEVNFSSHNLLNPYVPIPAQIFHTDLLRKTERLISTTHISSNISLEVCDSISPVNSGIQDTQVPSPSLPQGKSVPNNLVTHVTLQGPADFVFQGTFQLKTQIK